LLAEAATKPGSKDELGGKACVLNSSTAHHYGTDRPTAGRMREERKIDPSGVVSWWYCCCHLLMLGGMSDGVEIPSCSAEIAHALLYIRHSRGGHERHMIFRACLSAGRLEHFNQM
jgi:hypothetical protein